MSAQLLLILAIVAMIGLAALRLARVRAGRTPLPERRRLFILAFLFIPPIVLGAVLQPGDGAAGPLRGLSAVPLYTVIVAGIALLMGLIALVVRAVAPGRSRPLLLLALVGSEGDPDDVPFDPPVTAKLAESVALVDRANAVFPRGPEFPIQVDRAGFRGAWDALDAATESLERGIADDYRLGVPVASTAKATAADARGRLDTLRNLAVDRGQAWGTS